MAYYDALKTIWPTLTGDNTQKLAQLNAMTVSGSVPTAFSVRGSQIYNCLDKTEYSALSAANQQAVRDIFNLGGDIPAGAGTTVQAVLMAIFGAGTTTRTNFLSLAKASTSPWWQANNYLAPININDLAAGGLS